MKFFKKHNNFLNKNDFYFLFNNNLNFNFKKLNIRKKIWSKIRKGVSINIKKNSIIRDKNLNLTSLLINLNCIDGEKYKFYKNLNKSFQSFYFLINNNLLGIKNKKNYNIFLSNYNNFFFNSDINSFLYYYTNKCSSVFEIKTKKNLKKLKKENKYTYEISYIPKERRLKYVLKSLKLYENNFKNFNLWERLFWTIFNFIAEERSFLINKKNYTYQKSIKFFKIKK